MADLEFGIEKQKLLIEYMLTDEQLFQRCHNILKPAYFEKQLQPSVKFILRHANQFSALPTPKQINAETGIMFNIIDEIREQDIDWTLNHIEKFCQRGAIVQAVYKAPDFIEKGNYGAKYFVKAKTHDYDKEKFLNILKMVEATVEKSDMFLNKTLNH